MVREPVNEDLRTSDTTRMSDTIREIASPLDLQGNGLTPEPSESFVETGEVESLTSRALTYLELGAPVHFCGPAGTGKTTLAFHVAAKYGRPVSLVHGNDDFGTGDLIGKDSGYTKRSLVDNYVHSVLKTEEDLTVKWDNRRLTTACQQGHVLIYDEFNRTKAEANNILLSILEEGVLNLPRSGADYMQVHPDFRVIFTSNPEEYAGVHKTQDALLDRMVTVEVDHFDQSTEVAIVMAKSGLSGEDAAGIVSLVRGLRAKSESGTRPSIRGAILLSRVVAHRGLPVQADNPDFLQYALDILASDGQGRMSLGFARDDFADVVKSILGGSGQGKRRRIQRADGHAA